MVYGAVVLAAIHFGEAFFLLALVAGAILSYYELWRLFARERYALSLPGGVVLVLTFLIVHEVWAQVRLRGLDVSFEAGLFFSIVVGSVLALAMIVGGGLALARPDLPSGLLSSGLTILGALYCGWLLGYLIDVASFGVIAAGPHVDPTSPTGYVLQRSGLLLTILPTWANDVAAYAVGAAFGRRKLLPRVSPGKTVEGTIGGLVASVLVGYALVTLLDFPSWVGVGVGLIVGVVGPLGDLVESAIKRAAAVKDSGGLLPGHGGMLDRLDSLIFIAPAVAIFFELALRFS
jgi:phosphatidate cytidylyltransferase